MKQDTKISMFGWFIFVLFVGLVFFISVFTNRLNSLEHPVTPADVVSNYYVDDNGNLARSVSVEQALLSDGWVKECVSSVNVSKHNLIDEYSECSLLCDSFNQCMDYMLPRFFENITFKDALTSGMSYWCTDNIGSICYGGSDVIIAKDFYCEKKRCMSACDLNKTIIPAHVDYYNESQCLKFVLVKYNGGGFNG